MPQPPAGAERRGKGGRVVLSVPYLIIARAHSCDNLISSTRTGITGAGIPHNYTSYYVGILKLLRHSIYGIHISSIQSSTKLL